MKTKAILIAMILLTSVLVTPVTLSEALVGPSASNDSYTVDEDMVLSVNATLGVLKNDTDSDGDVLNAIVVSGGNFGILTLHLDGSFTYTPLPDFNGIDTFSYVANDGALNSTNAQVSVTVNSVNDAPEAANDSASTGEDAMITINVLSNDFDPDDDSLGITSVTNPSHGTASINTTSKTIKYTPNANFNGQDFFNYTISDGHLSDSAAVTVNVGAINDSPVAQNDSYSVDEDHTLTIALPGVLSNDSDIDNDTLNAVLVVNVRNGTLSLSTSGGFTYVPDPNFNGHDSFTYKATDSSTNSNIATVTITVNPVDETPTPDLIQQLTQKINALIDRVIHLENTTETLKQENIQLKNRISHLEMLLNNGDNKNDDDNEHDDNDNEHDDNEDNNNSHDDDGEHDDD